MRKDNKEKEDNLILGQDKIEPKEQMKFDDDSRPDPSVEDDLGTRSTPFDKVDFPDVPEEHTTYEELLASEEYKNALDKLEQYTGIRNIGTGTNGEYAQLSYQAMSILQEIMQAENQHEEELEQLAEKIVRDYFKIPETALQFNFKLIKNTAKVKNKQTKEELQQKEEELMNDVNDLTPERAKRRLVNAMTQGHSVEGTYLFNKAANELEQITGVDNIVEKYGIFVATMMLGYWQFPPSTLDAAMGSNDDDDGQAAGKTGLDTTTNPPTVNAAAIIFPFLVHEGIKGVMEFLGKEKNPEDAEKTKAAMELEDIPEHEIWDIRLGPAIWRRLVKLFPNDIINNEDKKQIQYYIYSNIINLPTKEFLVLMKEVIGNTDDGKKLIDSMYYDISRKLDNEEVTNENSEFKNLLDELVGLSDINNEDLRSFLNDIGIGLSESVVNKISSNILKTIKEQAFNDAGEPLMTDKQYKDYSEPSEPEYDDRDFEDHTPDSKTDRDRRNKIHRKEIYNNAWSTFKELSDMLKKENIYLAYDEMSNSDTMIVCHIMTNLDKQESKGIKVNLLIFGEDGEIQIEIKSIDTGSLEKFLDHTRNEYIDHDKKRISIDFNSGADLDVVDYLLKFKKYYLPYNEAEKIVQHEEKVNDEYKTAGREYYY